MQDNGILCRCGHRQAAHIQHLCDGCILFGYGHDVNAMKEMCREYIADNLTTFEVLAKERNLI